MPFNSITTAISGAEQMTKKPHKKWEFLSYVLLSRPYTIPSIILIALLANVFIRKELPPDTTLFLDLSFALLTWFSMVYLNEAFHQDIGRKKIPYTIPAVFFIIAGIISAVVNPHAIMFLILALIGTALYRTKSMKWFGSPYMFFFRGLTEASIFLGIILLHKLSFTNDVLAISGILFLVTASRNMIGDIRDMAYDQNTFPVKHGEKISRTVSFILLLIAVIISPSIHVSFPLIIMGALILLTSNGYFLHKAYVATTVFYLTNYCYYFLEYDLTLINFVFISVLAGHTYKLITRKSNLYS
jgi:hypothetical protein